MRIRGVRLFEVWERYAVGAGERLRRRVLAHLVVVGLSRSRELRLEMGYEVMESVM